MVDVVGLVNGLSGWVGANDGIPDAPELNSEAKSNFIPPDCWRSFSIDIGVVETVGHPVNSVVALCNKKIIIMICSIYGHF